MLLDELPVRRSKARQKRLIFGTFAVKIRLILKILHHSSRTFHQKHSHEVERAAALKEKGALRGHRALILRAHSDWSMA